MDEIDAFMSFIDDTCSSFEKSLEKNKSEICDDLFILKIDGNRVVVELGEDKITWDSFPKEVLSLEGLSLLQYIVLDRENFYEEYENDIRDIMMDVFEMEKSVDINNIVYSFEDLKTYIKYKDFT